jgi:hypothetical protein
MTVHEEEWRRMTLEERVDSLRIHLLLQEAVTGALIQGLRGIGITVVERDGPDDSDDEPDSAESKTSTRRSQRRPPRRRGQPGPNA